MKPCPWCHSENVKLQQTYSDASVECKSCYARGPLCADGLTYEQAAKSAIDRWNDGLPRNEPQYGAITKIFGQLEIDHKRGVIYFHSVQTGFSILRICQLKQPIPAFKPDGLGVQYDLVKPKVDY